VGDTNAVPETESLAAKVLALDELEAFGDRLSWTESDRSGSSIATWSPAEGLVRIPFDVGSTVHSYGGGTFTISASGILAVEASSGQIWDLATNAPITSEPGVFAALTPSGPSVLAVHDRGESDELVEIDRVSGDIRSIRSAPFLSSPTVRGSRLAWAEWPESAAPWNHCEVWASADFREKDPLAAVRIAGGPEESAIEPKWGPDGHLYFLSDRTGWWNLYRWDGTDITPVAPVDADCAAAPWELGYSSYAFLKSGRIALLARSGPPARLLIASPGQEIHELTIPYTSIKPYIAAIGDRIGVIGSSPVIPAQIAFVDPDQADLTTPIRTSEPPVPGVPSSSAEIHSFESDGVSVTLVWTPPRHQTGGPVPTIVRAHPGPTHHLEMRLDADLWYYTDQGFAVIDVDYRGSTGYGREFRRSLYGHWGDFDARDCAGAARWAVDTGRAAAGEVFLVGASAGGFTALHAAALTDNPFAMAAARSAIVDPAKWVEVTPRFHRPNARALGGTAVEAADINIPVLLIHGDDDKVVPVGDIISLAESLEDIGGQVELIRFADGGHYLSSAKVRTSVLEAEVKAFHSTLSHSRSGPRA
jgi:alpha-beta hydrolase superfamily lysophospholipase